MKRLLLAALLFALPGVHADTPKTPPPATATDSNNGLTRDLGRGLVYHRVRHLPADLPSAEAARKRPTVLDVRYVHGDAAAGAALVAWLKFYASFHTPVFVLANTETSRAILAALAARGPAASILVVGAPAPDFAPDIAIQTTGEVEKQAYDAIAAGADPATLIVENADKVRNDEASLAHDSSTEPQADPTKEHAPPPPLDAALQRAVHLHRTLVALRKI